MRGAHEARKWARALWDAAHSAGVAREAGHELSLFARALQHSQELVNLMWYPGVGLEEKMAAISSAIATELSPVGRRFISLLIEAGRFGLSAEIMEEYERLLEQDAGIVKARVTSARPLAPPQKERLKASLEGRLRKQVEMLEEADPGVIGGVKIIVEDLVIDGTASHMLRRFMKG